MDLKNFSSKKYSTQRQQKSSEIIKFQEALEKRNSQRAASVISGIPRSTARDRLARKEQRDLPLDVQAFFETQSGLEFLHRIVLAAEFVITQVVDAGIRPVQLFLQLTHLDDLVASSVGSLKSRIETMEHNISQFGKKSGRSFD